MTNKRRRHPEGSEKRRLWISPTTFSALSNDERAKADLLLAAYRQNVSLWDAPNPLAPDLGPYRRLFRSWSYPAFGLNPLFRTRRFRERWANGAS
jgi:hypothetical protein